MDVTGYTAARMKSIEDNSVVDGDVVGGHLILKKFNETTIDAGVVVGATGAKGDKGDTGGIADAPNDGSGYVRKGELWTPVSAEIATILPAYANKHQVPVTGGPVGGTGVTLATINIPSVLIDSVVDVAAFWTPYNTQNDNVFDFEIQVGGVQKAIAHYEFRGGVHQSVLISIPTCTLTTLTVGNGTTVLFKSKRVTGTGTLEEDVPGVATATVTPV